MRDRATADRRRDAFRKFMEARGLNANEWARRARLPNANGIYNFLGGRSQSLHQGTLEALAAAEDVPVSDLVGDSVRPISNQEVTLLVRGIVRAGEWQEAAEFDADDQRRIVLPKAPVDFGLEPYLLEVHGSSMDRLYPHGTLIEVVNLPNYNGVLKSGNKVVVHRWGRNGLVEATCKELEVMDGEAWLWPRSTDPKHQQPISMPWPPQIDDEPRIDGIERIEIVAVVTRSIRSEV